jgi:hypothetical protein
MAMVDLGERLREAIVGELQRQASASEGRLQADCADSGRLRVSGDIDLDELAEAIAGALAGGP